MAPPRPDFGAATSVSNWSIGTQGLFEKVKNLNDGMSAWIKPLKRVSNASLSRMVKFMAVLVEKWEIMACF